MGEKAWVLLQLEAYIHVQTIPLTEIVIQHNKKKLYPQVTIIRDDGVPMEAVVDSIDENSIEIKLNLAVSFTAYIY